MTSIFPPRQRAFGILIVAALVLASRLAALAAPPATLPYVPVHRLDLPNGLRVLMVERREAAVISVQVWYHVGSKDETPGKTGFAHLFEHLMFQGTKNLGPEQFSDYIIRAGGQDNAYTTEDYTVYWETIPNTHLAVALWLEADRMRNLAISEKVFSTEREVVKEERRLRFDNQPYGTIVEKAYLQAFTVHPYRHPTIGSMDDLDRASVADIRHFYDTYYVPQNATLVIVGDFDRREAESLVQQYFGPLARGKALARAIPPEPPQTAPRVLKLTQNVALPALVAAYHMPADGTPDAYPLRLAARILSEGESSRIYRRLVYEQQIAFEANSAGNFTEDPNLFFVFAILNAGHTPAEGEAAIRAELEGLKNQLVPEEELNKAKNQIWRDFVLSRESAKGVGEELGYAAVVLKDPELLNTELERFLAVTPEDIRRVARKYFVPENMTVVEVHPQSESETAPEPVEQEALGR